MFTGIIEETGTVISINKDRLSARLCISGKAIFDNIKLGDSVAVNGVCLTASSFSGNTFTADVMHETLDRSSIGTLKPGHHVNLERALQIGGRLGGHLVSGHIDGTGIIRKIEKDDNAFLLTIETTDKLMRYIIEKGSIAIDGISLTVAKTNYCDFNVSIIPHTFKNTTLSEKRINDTVNLENDIVGKYIAHFLRPSSNINNVKNQSPLTMSFLKNAGF